MKYLVRTQSAYHIICSRSCFIPFFFYFVIYSAPMNLSIYSLGRQFSSWKGLGLVASYTLPITQSFFWWWEKPSLCMGGGVSVRFSEIPKFLNDLPWSGELNRYATIKLNNRNLGNSTTMCSTFGLREPMYKYTNKHFTWIVLLRSSQTISACKTGCDQTFRTIVDA